MITLKLRPKRYFDEKPIYEQQKAMFWKNIFGRINENDSKYSDDYISIMENKIKEVLPQKLKSHLLNLIEPIKIIRTSRDSEFLDELKKGKFNDIKIEVREIRYSSINITVDISPISALVELFNNDYSLVYPFFEQYLPSAFFETINDVYPNASNVDSTIEISKFFEQNFINHLKTESKVEQSKSSIISLDTIKKSGLFWWVANTTLIVPAVIFYYFLYKENEYIKVIMKNNMDYISKENENINNHYNLLITKQNEIYNDLYLKLQENPKFVYSGKSTLNQYQKLLNTQDTIFNSLLKSQSKVITRFDDLGK
jgi:hypothetical protein